MRITSISTEGVGPLPGLTWEPGAVEVVYDDNQQGKTTLIDLVIETVFREGRKKLFADARRYDEYGKARVVLENDSETVTFGDDGDDVAFSDLLGWKLPELHRLLCIRASEVSLSGPRESEEIWESLASVVEGLQDNYLDSIYDTILDRGRITGTFSWENRDPDYFEKHLHEDVVPGLERAREGEEVLREAIERKKELREAENREQTLRDETLERLSDKLNRLERQRALIDLDQAEERLEEARRLKNELDEDFGRIRDEFEDPWEQARDERDDVRTRLKEQKQTLEEYRTERKELRERRDELREDLDELEGSIGEKKERLNQLEAEREDQIGERRDERSMLDKLTRRAERASQQAEAWTGRWEWAQYVLLGGVILLAGSLVVTPFWFLYGLIVGIAGLVGTTAGFSVYWLKYSYRTTLQETEESLAEELETWPVEPSDDPLGTARDILNQDPQSLLGDLSDALETTRETLQSQREDRSGKQGTLDSLEDQLEGLDEKVESIESEIEDDEKTLDSLEESCEEFRRKTGMPDFETYENRLEKRRERSGRLQSLKSQLIGQLDLDDNAELPAIRTEVQQRREQLEDVEPSEASREELESEIEATEDEVESAERELEELQDRVRSLNEQKNEIVRPLHDLGVDMESPEVLFEKENQWEQTLTEAVRDRLAAAFSVRLLERQKGDYMNSIQELLERGQEDGRSISEMYARVMGEDNRVSLDPQTGTFSVENDGRVVPEENLSSGARTHLYFACRLILLKELFVEESGFIILDDPFLTYYPERKERAVELLQPFVEDGWQILFFTVDPTARDLFSEKLDAEVRSVEDLV